LLKDIPVRVNPKIVKSYESIKGKPLRMLISILWAKIHLLILCPICSKYKRRTRDIEGIGECYWYYNWTKKNYDIPLWMGTKEWLRFRKELRSKK